jgi:polar amino acid transport system substrate-binding protein
MPRLPDTLRPHVRSKPPLAAKRALPSRIAQTAAPCTRRAWTATSRLAIAAFVAALLFVVAVSPAIGGPLIIFYVERPPYSHTLSDGTAAGLLVDAAKDILRLADIDHEFRPMPVPRILQELEAATQTAAALGFFKTPSRAATFKFSDAMYDDGPLLLIYATPSFLPDRTQARLAHILAQPGIRIGAIEGYSYGQQADTILKAHSAHVHRVSGVTEQLYRMLAAGRINGFLARKPDSDHAADTFGYETNHAVLRDVPPPQYRYLMFSRNVGDDLIARINAAIGKLAKSPAD